MQIDSPISILVFRNGSIGNTLVALPAIRALKQEFPNALLSVILDRTGAELLKHSSFIDNIILYDKRGIHKGLVAHLKFIHRLRKLHPSHAILFKRFFRNGLLAYLSGARHRIGFRTGGKAPFLTEAIPYDESIHIAKLNMDLLGLVGIQSEAKPYTIELSERDHRDTQQAMKNAGLYGKQYAVIHYGGSTTRPDFFPVERMCELLRPFAESKLDIVFIGAGDSERELSNTVVKKLGRGKLLFDLPIRTMSSVVAAAECFIGFNSGPAHIAAGVGTKGIVIYRPDTNVSNEIRKWRPLSEDFTPLIAPDSSDDAEWKSFFDDAHHRIASMISQTDSAKS